MTQMIRNCIGTRYSLKRPMDLSNPIRSVIPLSQGVVLEILARTDAPLTGRTIASLANGRASQAQISRVLQELVAAGLVIRRKHPPAHLFTLNRDHVAADAVEQLARLRETLLERMRHQIAAWQVPPAAVWLFGSLARGEGDVASDIDVLLLAPDGVSGVTGRNDAAESPDPKWSDQVDQFSDDVYRWSGNDCRVVEFTEPEFAAMLQRGDRLALDVIQDGVHLGGKPLPRRRRGPHVSAS